MILCSGHDYGVPYTYIICIIILIYLTLEVADSQTLGKTKEQPRNHKGAV